MTLKTGLTIKFSSLNKIFTVLLFHLEYYQYYPYLCRYNTDINFPRYKSDYIKLYIDTVYSTVKQEDTSRPFIASSPSNGMESEAEGWVAKDPGSALYGDSKALLLNNAVCLTA